MVIFTFAWPCLPVLDVLISTTLKIKYFGDKLTMS